MPDPENPMDDDHPDIVRQRDRIKALEKQVADLTPKAERADAADRELAFAKAGVDITDERNGYFVRGYTGDLTVEAIKEAATKGGFLTGQTIADPENPEPVDDDAEALARRAEAMGGEPPAPPGLAEAIANAKTPAEVMAAVEKFQPQMAPSMHGA